MPAKKPKKTAKKKAKKSSKKVVKKAAKKSAKKKPIKKAAKKPAKKPVKKAAKKIAKPKTAAKAKKPAKAVKPKAAKTAPKPKGTPVKFQIDAPNGWDVAVAGNFNNWEPRAMVKEPDGIWRITLHLAPGTYQYRFLVDTVWREDPNNSRNAPNEYGANNSIIVVN